MAKEQEKARQFGFFSPLITRELLGLARRPWTFWSRTLVSFIAVAILAVVVSASSGGSLVMNDGAGASAAAFLIVGMFFAACLTGLQSTNDCISIERRQGTLGLLFLTDLTPSTVLFAKLVSSSFQNLYALLAMFPILATCVLAGGVNGMFFIMAPIAVLYALILSSVIGLLQSCKTEDAHVAFSRSIRWFVGANLIPCVSPLALLIAAVARFELYFWFSACVGVIVIFAIWLKCRRFLSAHWRGLPKEHQMSVPTTFRELVAVESEPATEPDARRPAPCRDSEPAAWLIARYGDLRQVSPREYPIPFAAIIAFVFLIGAGNWDAVMFGNSYLILTCLLRFLLVLTMCKIAPHGFGEVIRGGGVEILLTTPLTVSRLIRGARNSLARQFRNVLVVMAITDVLCAALSATRLGFDSNEFAHLVRSLVISNLLLFLGLGASGFFGVWMGLRYTRLTQAVTRTALVQILVPFLIYFQAASDKPRAWLTIAAWYIGWMFLSRWRIKRFVNASRDGASLSSPD